MSDYFNANHCADIGFKGRVSLGSSLTGKCSIMGTFKGRVSLGSSLTEKCSIMGTFRENWRRREKGRGRGRCICMKSVYAEF